MCVCVCVCMCVCVCVCLQWSSVASVVGTCGWGCVASTEWTCVARPQHSCRDTSPSETKTTAYVLHLLPQDQYKILKPYRGCLWPCRCCMRVIHHHGLEQEWPNRGLRATCGSLICNMELVENFREFEYSRNFDSNPEQETCGYIKGAIL